MDNPTNAAEHPKGRAQLHKSQHEVTFITYPKLLFVWPLILAGIVLWPFGAPAAPQTGADAAVAETSAPAPTSAVAPAESPAPPAPGVGRLEWVGWIYLWVAFIVILTLSVDIDRNHAVFWFVVIIAFWFLGLWLQDRNYTFFGDIYRWFASLDVQYNRSLGLSLSVLLFVPYLIMLIYARLNDRWRITHNEFEHYAFGKMDDSLGRGAKTIRSSFPDVLELLLGMAGTLIVYNATGTKELRRIPHVMLLPFVRKRLNRILEKTAITAAMAADEEEDEDDEN